MGRKSKLSESQWGKISKRLLAGESAGALAKEFGVARSTITERFSGIHGKIKDVANQIVTTEAALKDLPISAQVSAIDLAAQLRSVSEHLLGAANYGAATAHRLAGIAHGAVQKIDDADPLSAESVESLKGVSALTRLANDASNIGLNLLAANKEATKKVLEPEPDASAPQTGGVLVVPGIMADPAAWTTAVKGKAA